MTSDSNADSPRAKGPFKIAIQPDFLQPPHGPQQSFSKRWVELLEQAGHEARVVDAFGPDFFDRIQGCDGFLWWFPPIPFPRDMARRLMLTLGHVSEVPTLPAWRDCWHFDDKVAQSYLLRAAGIPTPRTWVFWQNADAQDFCRTAQYPLVIKLRSGVFSQNVRLLRDRAEAEYWIKRLFNPGLLALERPAGPLPLRALKRLRAALGVLARGHGPDIGGLDFHKDYLLLQEFIPENDFDTRITVIGKRAFGARRLNRPQDFRASGSGDIDLDPSLIGLDLVRLGFRVAQRLGAQTICMDVLRRAGEPVLCEVSYFFMGAPLHECPGHWELDGDLDTGHLEWIEGQVQPEDAILEDFLARIALSQEGIAPAPGELPGSTKATAISEGEYG